MMPRIDDLHRHPMSAIVFDTLSYAEKLQAAGFTPEQAKGQAHAMREIIHDQIATKRDVAVLDASVEAKLVATKAELVKWYIGTMFAMTGLIVGLLKLVS